MKKYKVTVYCDHVEGDLTRPGCQANQTIVLPLENQADAITGALRGLGWVESGRESFCPLHSLNTTDWPWTDGSDSGHISRRMMDLDAQMHRVREALKAYDQRDDDRTYTRKF